MKTIIVTDRARRGTGHEGSDGHRGASGRGGHRSAGRYGHEAAAPSTEGLAGFLKGRLPEAWSEHSVTTDRDEVTIEVTLPAVTDPDEAAGTISRWREETRDERVTIAREVEARWGRSVAWAATSGEAREAFTRVSVPVMTRLHQSERQVLDTLVDAGVARSRSDALAWSVRLVGQHADEWLGELRSALTEVEKLRSQGPL